MNMGHSSNKAFILIEILVSVLILSLGILFLIRSLAFITRSNSTIRNNRISYLIIDNVYNSIYSGLPVTKNKITIDNTEYTWELIVNNTEKMLKDLTIQVTSNNGSLTKLISFPHTILDLEI